MAEGHRCDHWRSAALNYGDLLVRRGEVAGGRDVLDILIQRDPFSGEAALLECAVRRAEGEAGFALDAFLRAAAMVDGIDSIFNWVDDAARAALESGRGDELAAWVTRC